MDGVGIGDILFIILIGAIIYGLLALKGRGAGRKMPEEDRDGGCRDD